MSGKMPKQTTDQNPGRKKEGSILPRIAAGDRAAVQECIDHYGNLIWALARRQSPNQHDAEDAVQEIFIDLWKNAARFDEAQSSEVTFVAMVARRRLIDRLRAAQRRPELAEIPEQLLEDLIDTKRQDRALEANAEVARATRAMNELKPEQQRVLRLSIWQGMSHHEIAETTGMPLGTVKTYVRRGLLHIREALGIRNLDSLGEGV